MSTAQQGVSLLQMQEQMAAMMAQLQGLQGLAGDNVPQTPAVTAPAANGKRRKANSVTVAATSATVPTINGASITRQSKAEPRANVKIIGRLEDGTAVTIGQGHGDTSPYGYGFRIGDGRVKWGKATTWNVQCALAAQIMAYLEANPTK